MMCVVRNETDDDLKTQIAEDGFAVITGAFDSTHLDRIAIDFQAALASQQADSDTIQSREGVVYAARNVLQFYPGGAEAWRTERLERLLTSALGSACGLVRVLYFDKPPEQTWSLAWHRDQAIAVQDNSLASELFTKPTHKAGVPHVNAPRALLERMLTLRLHLDDVTEENGPLRVIPGSHLDDEDSSSDTAMTETIYVNRGDVLAMRPLILHSSGKSDSDTTRHRRILHFEFAANRELPDGYLWYDFLPVSIQARSASE